MNKVELPDDVVRALARGYAIRIDVAIDVRMEGERLRVDAELSAPGELTPDLCKDLMVDAVAQLVARMEPL